MGGASVTLRRLSSYLLKQKKKKKKSIVVRASSLQVTSVRVGRWGHAGMSLF